MHISFNLGNQINKYSSREQLYSETKVRFYPKKVQFYPKKYNFLSYPKFKTTNWFIYNKFKIKNIKNTKNNKN